MTDLDKLIETFDAIGVEYDLSIVLDEEIVCVSMDGYNNDFVFINGKFSRVEIY